ncbi:hypothetical protein ACLOJK_006258 [Asimina triloba]
MGSFTLTASPRSFPSRLRSFPAAHLTRLLLPTRTAFAHSTKSKHSSVTASTLACFRCQSKSSMAEAAPTASKGKRNLLVFDTEEELAASLAKYVADLSENLGKGRGSFSVVLSGGSLIKALRYMPFTPTPRFTSLLEAFDLSRSLIFHSVGIFRKLLEPPYIDSIEWGKWHVFWVDERVVPKDHVDSNYKLAYDGFLWKRKRCITCKAIDCNYTVLFNSVDWIQGCGLAPIPPGNVYAINDALPAEGAADDYETCLRQLVKSRLVDVSTVSGFPKFDLMLLGMGPDGHVASLFPGHPLVNEKQRWVTFIKDSPKPPPERITFTFPVINSSAHIAMVVTGAGKADAVKTALESDQALPAGMVSPEGESTWFADKAAASKLKDPASL